MVYNIEETLQIVCIQYVVVTYDSEAGNLVCFYIVMSASSERNYKVILSTSWRASPKYHATYRKQAQFIHKLNGDSDFKSAATFVPHKTGVILFCVNNFIYAVWITTGASYLTRPYYRVEPVQPTKDCNIVYAYLYQWFCTSTAKASLYVSFEIFSANF